MKSCVNFIFPAALLFVVLRYYIYHAYKYVKCNGKRDQRRHMFTILK